VRKWTYLEIKQKVEADLDLADEDLVQDSEMRGYCNEAIDDAEAEIHSIYEDYFFTSASLALVDGESLVDLPTDIYANKIRLIQYDNGSDKYPIARLKPSQLKEIANVEEGDRYRYLIMNSSSDGSQIKLYPAAQEDSSDNVTIYYIRNATRIEEDSDECDIPEFTNFIIQFMKVRCIEKELGPEGARDAKAELERVRKLMVDTLTAMVPDNENLLEQDVSFYEEMV
jgi:hypothetical protein